MREAPCRRGTTSVEFDHANDGVGAGAPAVGSAEPASNSLCLPIHAQVMVSPSRTRKLGVTLRDHNRSESKDSLPSARAARTNSSNLGRGFASPMDRSHGGILVLGQKESGKIRHLRAFRLR